MSRTIPDKVSLRIELRQKLSVMTIEERKHLSRKLVERIEGWKEWKYVKNVMLYMPLPSEPDVRPLIGALLQKYKSIGLPRYDSKTDDYCAAQVKSLTSDLRHGQYNILEPSPECPCIPINQLDIILVPGLGFDLQGRRLGRGRGYYDKLLAAATGLKCGVAFDEQILPTIPVEAHDVHLDWVFTPARLFEV